MLSEFEAKNNIYLGKLINEEHVDVRKFPNAVMRALKKYSDEVLADLTSKDPSSKKIYESFNNFRNQVGGWAEISEKVYYSWPQTQTASRCYCGLARTGSERSPVGLQVNCPIWPC